MDEHDKAPLPLPAKEGKDHLEALKVQLQIEQIKLAQKLEETKQKQEETKQKQEETKQKQEETKKEQLITTRTMEQEKTKQLQLYKDKRDADEREEERKRLKIDGKGGIYVDHQVLRDITTSSGYLEFCVKNNIEDMDINMELNHEEDVSDAMVDVFKKYFGDSIPNQITEKAMQKLFDDFMNELFFECKDLTSLKYLNTSQHGYIGASGRCPDCTFTYRNININLDPYCEFQGLIDFVVCIGELKVPTKSIDYNDYTGQLWRYLADILSFQDRTKIYGFLTNLKSIQFYYVEKGDEKSVDRLRFFRSQKLEFFSTSSESASNDNNGTSAKALIDKETIKIFIKFLIMKPIFYGYNMLNISPNDDLHGNEYYIKSRLGTGATSMTYLLLNNDYEKTRVNRKAHVLKISKPDINIHCFLNEVKILKQLKDSDAFHLFFSNVLSWSPEGKFILFENRFESLKSMTIVEAEQLIDIIEYLYNRRILHRDIRPENLMYNSDDKHLKLIDFGFATTFETNENQKSLEIKGVISFADVKLINTYLKSIEKPWLNKYEYERNFDLVCAINLIMYNVNVFVSTQFALIRKLSVAERFYFLDNLWCCLRRTKKNYDELLNLVENLSNPQDFQTIKASLDRLAE